MKTKSAVAESRGARSALVLVAMCLGAATTFLQITSAAGALGAMQAGLHLSPSQVIWVPSAYTLPVASLILLAGEAGSRYGRRRVFLTGAAVMALGASIVALAGSFPAVIAGQLVTGVGGAMVLPTSLALLGAAFPDPHRRAEVITAWAAASGIGLAAGPVVSGALLRLTTWHLAFLPTVLLGLLSLAAAWRWAPESRDPVQGRLDVPGALLGTLTIAALVFALIQGGHQGYAAPTVLIAWCVAAAGLVAFLLAERRAAAPMLDLTLFRSASFSAVMVVAAVSLFGFTGVAILSVLFYEQVDGFDALDTGLRMLALFGAYVVVAFLSGRAIRYTGFRAPLASGLVIGAIACLGLAGQQPGDPFTSTGPWLALFGVACGLVAAPSTAAALVSVGPARAGSAAAAVNTARQIGAVVGTSLLGSVLTTRLLADLPGTLADNDVPMAARPAVQQAVETGSGGAAALPEPLRESVGQAIREAFTHGHHLALFVAAGVCLAAAVLVMLAVRNRPA